MPSLPPAQLSCRSLFVHTTLKYRHAPVKAAYALFPLNHDRVRRGTPRTVPSRYLQMTLATPSPPTTAMVAARVCQRPPEYACSANERCAPSRGGVTSP